MQQTKIKWLTYDKVKTILSCDKSYDLLKIWPQKSIRPYDDIKTLFMLHCCCSYSATPTTTTMTTTTTTSTITLQLAGFIADRKDKIQGLFKDFQGPKIAVFKYQSQGVCQVPQQGPGAEPRWGLGVSGGKATRSWNIMSNLVHWKIA